VSHYFESVNSKPFLARTIFAPAKSFFKRLQTLKMSSSRFRGLQFFVTRQNPWPIKVLLIDFSGYTKNCVGWLGGEQCCKNEKLVITKISIFSPLPISSVCCSANKALARQYFCLAYWRISTLVEYSSFSGVKNVKSVSKFWGQNNGN